MFNLLLCLNYVFRCTNVPLMKIIYIICFLFLTSSFDFANPYTDNLSKQLNQELKEARKYDDLKLQHIFNLKKSLAEQKNLSYKEKYDIYLKLYEEYKSYI